MNELLKKDFIDLYNNKTIISTYMLNDIKEDYLEKNKMNDIYLKFLKSNHKSFDSNSKDYENTYLEGFGSYQNDVIKMYRSKLMLYYLYLYKKDNIYMLNEDEIGYFNLACVNTLIHELTHAKQDKIVKQEIDAKDAIYKILKVDFNQTNSDFYDKYYDYFITEYNANLEASIYINKLVNNTNLKHLNTKETLRLIEKAYKDEVLGIKFLNLLGDNMDNYNYEQLTIKERVLYGFPRK